MFTLKFKSHGNFETVISCRKYVIYRDTKVEKDGESYIAHQVIAYGETFSPDGTEFRISNNPGELNENFAVCFVENIAGKTIDRITVVE